MTAPLNGGRTEKPDLQTQSIGTRDRILAATARTLTVRGYAGTRLTDVAGIAGLRAPGMYHYFASRDDLVTEVLRVGQRRLLDHVEHALARSSPHSGAAERIRVAIDAHLRLELELSDFATAVTRNSGQVPAHIRDALQSDSDDYHSLWRGLIEAAGDEGILRPNLDVRVARMLVIGALNWAPEWWHAAGTPIENLVDTAQTIICHGLFDVTES